MPQTSLPAMRVQISPIQFSRLENTRKHWLDELANFLAFPAISALPSHYRDLEANAAWLVQHLSGIGLHHAQILPGINSGKPSVYADWLLRPDKPTLLVYGHYDVQPVDPVSSWHSPPFKATFRNNRVYARGASDDKGQLFLHLKAIESYLKTSRRLPVNVKVWIEGEEEIGSPTIHAFMKRYAGLLRADAALVSDTEMISPDCPSIIYGLRGSLNAELEIIGPKHDLHSGRFGGGVHNPLQALCEILSTFHDREGRIAIAGFYDNVKKDYYQLARHQAGCSCCALKEQQIIEKLGIGTPWGEPGYSPKARMTSRPALTINGLKGGYTGPGSKAVIPSKGAAKFSFRLVPDQTPQEVEWRLKRHLARYTPKTVKARLKIGQGSNPVLLPIEHPIMHAATRAIQSGWGKAPTLTRNGGTIPVVEEIQRRLNIPIVLMGFGLPDDAIHAPNESMSLSQFFRGVETSIHFLKEAGSI